MKYILLKYEIYILFRLRERGERERDCDRNYMKLESMEERNPHYLENLHIVHKIC